MRPLSSLLIGRSCKQGVRIDRGSAELVHAIVQMMRRSSGVAGITDVADDITGHHPVTSFERTKISQMRIVVRLPPRPHYPDYITA